MSGFGAEQWIILSVGALVAASCVCRSDSFSLRAAKSSTAHRYDSKYLSTTFFQAYKSICFCEFSLFPY